MSTREGMVRCRCGKVMHAELLDYICENGRVRIRPGYRSKPEVYIEDRRVPAWNVRVLRWDRAKGHTTNIRIEIGPYRGCTTYEVDRTSRVCPFCQRKIPLMMGDAPGYYLALLGPPNTGKTSFAHCLCSPTGRKHLEDTIAGYGLTCGEGTTRSGSGKNLIRQNTPDVSDDFLSEATESGVLHPFWELPVYDKNGPLRALFYLDDRAGEEIFLNTNNGLSQTQRAYIQGDKKVADAYLIFFDPEDVRSLGGKHSNHSDYGLRKNLTASILHADRRKEVLLVMTKADTLEKKFGSEGSLFRRVGVGKEENPYRLGEELAEHMALARKWFQDDVNTRFEFTSPRENCFVISSGCTTFRGDGVAVHHCGCEKNSPLPIAFLIRRWIC